MAVFAFPFLCSWPATIQHHGHANKRGEVCDRSDRRLPACRSLVNVTNSEHRSAKAQFGLTSLRSCAKVESPLRALSSVGERCLHTAEVTGSNPVVPTMRFTLIKIGRNGDSSVESFHIPDFSGGTSHRWRILCRFCILTARSGYLSEMMAVLLTATSYSRPACARL